MIDINATMPLDGVYLVLSQALVKAKSACLQA